MFTFIKKHLIPFILIVPLLVFSQKEYLNYSEMTSQLKQLATQKNCSLESYGKSFSGKDLWVLKIGNDKKPAILIVAGLDGSHQSGTQTAILLAKKLINENKTFYIICNINSN